MKRILPILILLGIAAGAISNPYLMVLARKNAGGEELKEDIASSGASTFNAGITSANHYRASSFTASGSYTITRIEVYAAELGSTTDKDLTYEIWSESGGNPNALLYSSDTAAVTDLPSTAAYFSIPFSAGSPEITVSTTYFVAVHVDGDSGFYAQVYYDGTGSESLQVGNSVASWTETDATAAGIRCRIYGQ